jgi:hypothetical protein
MRWLNRVFVVLSLPLACFCAAAAASCWRRGDFEWLAVYIVCAAYALVNNLKGTEE